MKAASRLFFRTFAHFQIWSSYAGTDVELQGGGVFVGIHNQSVAL